MTFAQLQLNDVNVDGGPTTVTIIEPTTVDGTFSVDPGNSFTYTPSATATATLSFQYILCRNTGQCDTATISIKVDDVNFAPVPAADAYTLDEDSTLVVTVPGLLANDTDQDGDLLRVEIVTPPASGTLILRPDGSFEYTPVANETGQVVFRYRVCDGSNACAEADVTLTITPVNDAPVGQPDEVAVTEDGTATGSVLTNDTDEEGDALTATVLTDASHGTLALNADGTFTYTPDLNFNGTDVVTYVVCDNGAPSRCDTTTITFNVSAGNDAPIAGDDAYTGTEDTEMVIAFNSGILGTDTDADGDPLSTALVTAPNHGTLTLAANGSFRYMPYENFNGLDTFIYRVCDPFGACDEAQVILRINAVNDRPVAGDDSITTDEDAAVILDPANPALLLVNDRDPDGDALTATPIGTLQHGTLVANPNGTYTYTPDPNFTGTDYIYYQLCDNGAPSLCDTAFVTITVRNLNDAPVARRDSFTVSEDLILSVPAPQGVLVNDNDPDGESIVTSVESATLFGRLTFNNDGAFTYQPNLNYNGVDSFTYRICDAGNFAPQPLYGLS